MKHYTRKIVLPDPSTTYFQSSIATVLILNKILLMKTSIYILLTFYYSSLLLFLFFLRNTITTIPVKTNWKLTVKYIKSLLTSYPLLSKI